MAEAQPGQGQGEAGGGLFDSYLQSVPEEHRATLLPYFEDAAKNVNGRLEEAAELRKTLSAFEEAGLTQQDPADLQQLVAWRDAVQSSPDAWKEFVSEAAKEAGLTIAEQQQAVEESELSREQIAAMIQETAAQQVAPIQQWAEQQEFNQAVETENRLINARLDELQATNKVKLTDDQRALVLDLASTANPGEDKTLTSGFDWITPGWERYQKMSGEAQKTFVEQKLEQPKPSLASGGTPAFTTAPGWKAANERAAERMRQSHS